ncbi:MAG: class I SAM-dependent methyltransferase [Alphaproteobacteria bacterium]
MLEENARPATPDFAQVSDVFQGIYRRGAWGKGSGGGSKIELTRGYIEFLMRAMDALDVRSVVDIGCGDWQFSQFVDWGDRIYTGVDVDPELIETNTKRFGAPNIRFRRLDVFKEAPFGDLLICKDVLQHWTIEMVLAFREILPNFRYALITNCMEPAAKRNIAVDLGRFRPLDVSAAPFNLPVVPVYDFRGPTWHKVVMLWTRESARVVAPGRDGEWARFSTRPAAEAAAPTP